MPPASCQGEREPVVRFAPALLRRPLGGEVRRSRRSRTTIDACSTGFGEVIGIAVLRTAKADRANGGRRLPPPRQRWRYGGPCRRRAEENRKPEDGGEGKSGRPCRRSRAGCTVVLVPRRGLRAEPRREEKATKGGRVRQSLRISSRAGRRRGLCLARTSRTASGDVAPHAMSPRTSARSRWPDSVPLRSAYAFTFMAAKGAGRTILRARPENVAGFAVLSATASSAVRATRTSKSVEHGFTRNASVISTVPTDNATDFTTDQHNSDLRRLPDTTEPQRTGAGRKGGRQKAEGGETSQEDKNRRRVEQTSVAARRTGMRRYRDVAPNESDAIAVLLPRPFGFLLPTFLPSTSSLASCGCVLG